MLTVYFGDESPQSIPGLKAWYDATTINQADGTSVTAWLDQSGNEAHMYQSTTAAQPTLQTNELNGRPVVRFDGTDDFMNLTAPFDVTMSNTVGVLNATSVSPNGQYFVHGNGPSAIIIYKKNGNNFNKVANPATLPAGTVYSSAWSSDSNYLAVPSANSPFVTIYKRSGDTFTKLANPATLPAGSAYYAHFSHDDAFLIVCHSTSPFITIYSMDKNTDTFTKISNPSLLPSGASWVGKFSTNKSFLAIGNSASTWIEFYSISGTTFTKLTAPTTLPSSDVYTLDWLDDQTCLVGSGATSIRIYQYASGTNTFELLSTFNPSVGSFYAISHSRNKNYLAISGSSSPFFKVFSRSGTTYTAIADPSSLPLGAGRGIAWGLDDTSLVVSHTTAPNIQAYTFDGTTLTNLTKLNMFRNVGGASVFVVAKYATSGAFSQSSFAATVNTSSGSSRVYTGQQAATTKYMTGGRRLDADSFQSTLSTTTTTGGYILQTGVTDYNNSNQYIYINGKLETSNLSFQTDGLTSNTNSLAIYLGNIATEWLNGDIAEVIVYNRALSDNEIKVIHQYLSKKWGIALVP